jgi:hypothetical protein
MSIVESLALGTRLLLLIVIQDQEIVIDEYNGLLVENYNVNRSCL